MFIIGEVVYRILFITSMTSSGYTVLHNKVDLYHRSIS